MLQFPIYLDNSATTPCDERVVEAMIPYYTKFYGNASSRSHSLGWQAAAAVEDAREKIAALLGSTPREIYFTSGATEACNLAIRGVMEMYAVKGKHIITTKTEHKAVLDTCKILEKNGVDITYIDVDGNGIIDLEALKSAITSTTVLIAAIFANNETGVISPVKEIGTIAKERNVLFFTDATQAFGKISIDVEAANISLLACSAHKIYGPKGVGAIYIKRRNPRVKLIPQITGGGQEHDIRSGTLNVPGIVGFGRACSIYLEERETEYTRLYAFQKKMEAALLKIPDSFLNGHPQKRLPQVSNISFKYLNSSQILSVINKTIAISSGSACTSGSLDPSFVLKAMGKENDIAKSAIRFSTGRFTTQEELNYVVNEITNIIPLLRKESPAWQLRQ